MVTLQWYIKQNKNPNNLTYREFLKYWNPPVFGLSVILLLFAAKSNIMCYFSWASNIESLLYKINMLLLLHVTKVMHYWTNMLH